ncbi:MAG: hypothetical protein K1060chlam4_00485 [Candidatus Anoxychlamydiales bacterium]|nr:hypothetical protein [Candidatus Anoxychlamydiales bacterium]
MSTASISTLPLEIIVGNILPELPIRDLGSLARTSREYSAIVRDERFWHQLLKSEFKIDKPKEISSYKAFYQHCSGFDSLSYQMDVAEQKASQYVHKNLPKFAESIGRISGNILVYAISNIKLGRYALSVDLERKIDPEAFTKFFLVSFVYSASLIYNVYVESRSRCVSEKIVEWMGFVGTVLIVFIAFAKVEPILNHPFPLFSNIREEGKIGLLLGLGSCIINYVAQKISIGGSVGKYVFSQPHIRTRISYIGGKVNRFKTIRTSISFLAEKVNRLTKILEYLKS